MVDEPLPDLRVLTFSITCDEPCPSTCGRFLDRCVNLCGLSSPYITPVWAGPWKDVFISRGSSLPMPALEASIARQSSNQWLAQPQRPPDTKVTLHYPRTDASVRASRMSSRIAITHSPFFGKVSADILVKSCSTLEELEVRFTYGATRR